MKSNKRITTALVLIILAFNVTIAFSQTFNEDKISFGNFLKRMYTAKPFEGVKIVNDYNQEYLVSVISLEKAKYADPSVMNRMAQVKAQSQANTFINGSIISSDLIIETSEKKSNNTIESTVKTIELIREDSMGFTRGLELLTNFDNEDGTLMAFIYFRSLKNINN